MVDFYHEPPERRGIPPENAVFQQEDHNDGLGPLPSKWEKAYTENGETYFIDHSSGTSHWLDPRLSKFQKKSLEECQDDELPYGWEKIQDPQYGTYFIDHVNRRTQYENPVLEAKRRSERPPPQHHKSQSAIGSQQQSNPSLSTSAPSVATSKQDHFTRNPMELRGKRITTMLLKSSRGLGFTIIGGDDNIDEFLQIKSIVPNGPAWLDGKLETGDILVYVNDICTLGFKHHEMVNVFQSILAGETVTLEVCRGYPLPFDPNDPNTEVVTTIAVDATTAVDVEKTRLTMDPNMDGNYNFLDMSDTTPISIGGPSSTLRRSVRKQTSGSEENLLNDSKRSNDPGDSPKILNISIVKGPLGFGFTIADSAYGQKVKKILDPNCCKDLQEGDYLLAINNTSVIHMPHNSVVQVLKSCPKSESATLKIQRGQFFNGSLGSKTNRWRRSGDRFGLAKENDGINLFRSKTPTADLYSTQPKEILPTRPKTPLVDTRNRSKTPSSELNGVEEIDSVHHSAVASNDDRSKHISADAKSNSSCPDQDSINNEVPHMDPFSKLVTNISDRLADTSLNRNGRWSSKQHQATGGNVSGSGYDRDPVNFPPTEFYGTTSSNSATGIYSNSSNSIYAMAPGDVPPKLPFLAPVPTYHHDHCYCFECQDYQRYQRENLHQRQQQYNQYVQLQSANGRMMKRINDGAIDRRKANFSPMQLLPVQQISPTTPYGQQDEIGHVLTEVTLERQAQGFGFRIVGGTEEGSQVTVGHIVPGGSADSDSRIATGDEILSIDGHNVLQASHHRVVQLMGEAGQRGYCTMILRRRIQTSNPTQQQQQQTQQPIQYPYDVVVARSEHEGFGFVIISASNQYYGSTIGKLIPGSPADRCGELKVGDRIIAVNRLDIAGMTHGDVVSIIKDSGLYVRLTIGNPKEMLNGTGGNGGNGSAVTNSVGPGL